MKKLKEYEKHIKNPFDGLHEFAICGADIRAEWHFQSIDHAYCSLETKNIFLICPDCRIKMIEILTMKDS